MYSQKTSLKLTFVFYPTLFSNLSLFLILACSVLELSIRFTDYLI